MRLRVLDDGRHVPGQGSLAVAAGARRPRKAGGWLLLNPTATAATCASAPAGSQARCRRTAAAAHAVVLTDARLDQVAGLIGLRNGGSIDLYATPSVFENLSSAMPILPELQRHCEVHWHLVPVAGDQLSADFAVRGHAGLQLTAWDMGPPPAGCLGPQADAPTGSCIALGLHDTASGHRALYLRGRPPADSRLEAALPALECVLLEPEQALDPRAEAWLRALPAQRKYLLGLPAGSVTGDLQPLAAGEEIVV
ncbi:MAG: MBL fold metallo-hydrolase [Aquabacterium sp.]|jgi:pyrroloquinoline quinone biosynthesis protein B|nr:MBL fold metallo-hydrolase [Aquabacterium sp.]